MDTTNDCLVGVLGDDIVVLQPKSQMDRMTALRMAAYLQLLADPDGEIYGDVLQAIQES